MCFCFLVFFSLYLNKMPTFWIVRWKTACLVNIEHLNYDSSTWFRHFLYKIGVLLINFLIYLFISFELLLKSRIQATSGFKSHVLSPLSASIYIHKQINDQMANTRNFKFSIYEIL